MTVHTASVPAPAAAPVRAARVASNETSGRALARAVAVETRKLVNTRTGPVLIAAAALLSGAFAGGRALFPTTGTDFGHLASMAVVPASMISMVLAVLLVAGEFSARTASVTLTLDPRRGRLVLAKILTVLGLSVVATTLAVVAAALVMVVAPLITGVTLAWTFDVASLAVVAGNGAFLVLAGFAWALALRNAAAPIAFLLVWPTVAMLVGSISDTAARAMAFVDVDPLYELLPDAAVVGPLAVVVAAMVWIVAPGTVGTLRLLRDDL